MAFESLRDGNEEIYTMNAGGSDQSNLTVDSASDSHPRLKRAQAFQSASNLRVGALFFSRPCQDTVKVQLFLAVLLPCSALATISTVWVPGESMPGW